MDGVASKPSHRLKFERAYEHLRELDRRIRQWRDGKPYSTRIERDAENPNKVVVLATINPIPDELFTPVIGDVIQNLRASLDHLVFALSVRHSGSLTKEQAKVPKFPIFGCEDRQPGEIRFDNAGRKALKFVSEEARTRIGALQPYKVCSDSGGTADYTQSFLWS